MSKVVYTPRSILLTGGAGFIGSGTVLRLIREYRDYKVCAWEKGSVVTIYPEYILISINTSIIFLFSHHLYSSHSSGIPFGLRHCFFFDLMLIDCSFGQAGLLFFRVQLG